MNSQEIKEYIKKRSFLFWYVREEEKENISLIFLVETILNYGDENDVKELIRVMGIETVAGIFHRATSNRVRINYFPVVLNFFNLYFQRNAPGYSY